MSHCDRVSLHILILEPPGFYGMRILCVPKSMLHLYPSNTLQQCASINVALKKTLLMEKGIQLSYKWNLQAGKLARLGNFLWKHSSCKETTKHTSLLKAALSELETNRVGNNTVVCRQQRSGDKRISALQSLYIHLWLILWGKWGSKPICETESRECSQRHPNMHYFSFLFMHLFIYV